MSDPADPAPEGAPAAFTRHDHRACRAEALAAARARCAERGLRLTPARARALEVLLESHAALGAYEVLDRLREAGLGGQPPVAYRALNFLVEHGLAHRVERLNAFVACTCHADGDGAHAPMFMICRGCRRVAETAATAAGAALHAAAADAGFALERATVEAEGLCADCAGAEA